MTKIKKKLAAITEAVLGGIVTVAAVAWKGRAWIVDVAGGACLTTAAAIVAPAAGWAAAGVWLTLQAYAIERKGKP